MWIEIPMSTVFRDQVRAHGALTSMPTVRSIIARPRTQRAGPFTYKANGWYRNERVGDCDDHHHERKTPRWPCMMPTRWRRTRC